MSSTFRPSVLYSQNFLKDPRLVASLLDRLGMDRHNVVYEIGPGKGIITEQLALRHKHVIAIEKDPRLSALLAQKFRDRPNVTIHAADFLEYRLPRQPYNVFANIPFNITAAIVTRLTTAECPPQDAYLAIQQEAALMFLGQPHESLRALLLKPWFEMEIVHHFQRQDFIPAPRVDVVMLRLRKRGPPLISNADRQTFRDFVVHLFSSWQPTIGDALKSVFSRQQIKYLRRAQGFDPDVTPKALPCEQWLKLFESFKAIDNPQARRLIAGSENRLLRQQQNLQKIHRTRPQGGKKL